MPEPMNDNARIVREALIACATILECDMADDLMRLTALESELATAKADLERAREEARKGPALEPITRHDVDRAVEDERERCAFAAYRWAHESWGTPRFSLTDCRAALAPEQKGE